MSTLGTTPSTHFTPALSTEVTVDNFLVSNGDGTYREEEIAQFATQGDLGINLGDIITGATAGSVLFVDTFGGIWEDNANFFWDDTNNRLGIGTNSPSASAFVHVKGAVTNDDLLRLEAPASASASSFFMSCRDSAGDNRFLIAYTGNTQIIGQDALTTTVATTLRLVHQSTAVPAGGFGLAIDFDLHSSTNTSRAAADIIASWVTATDASRAARLMLRAFDTTDREGLRIEASGTAPMIGFLGGVARARSAAYTQTYSTADRTHAARTTAALTDSSGGTAGTTIAALPTLGDAPATADLLRDDLNTNVWPVLKNWIASVVDQINKGRTDTQDTAQVVNAIIDDLGDNAGFGLLND
jgi:hypothetical protein